MLVRRSASSSAELAYAALPLSWGGVCQRVLKTLPGTSEMPTSDTVDLQIHAYPFSILGASCDTQSNLAPPLGDYIYLFIFLMTEEQIKCLALI